MRIVILNSTLGSGATTKVLQAVQTGLSREGTKCTLLGLYRKNADDQGFDASSFVLEKSISKIDYLRLFMLLRSRLKKENPDVLICSLPFANIYGAIVGKLLGVKKIISISHGTFPFYKDLYLRVRLEMILGALNFFSFRVCVSENVRRSYTRKLDPFKGNFRVIHNASLISKYEITKSEARIRLGITSDQKVLITVGRLSEEKNHEFLFSLLNENHEFSLIVCGDGPRKKYLDELAAESGVKDRVQFLGHLNEMELSIAYAASDVFVFPSKSEGFGMAVVEAMQHELPVVTSDIDTFHEIVGTSGLILPLDLKEWRESIGDLFSKPKLRSEFVSKSKVKAQQFSKAEMIRSYLDLINM